MRSTIRRTCAVTALALAAVLVLAAPALAHEEISPKTLTTGQPAFLTLTAANEAPADLTKIVLTAPTGLRFGETTRSPSGWTASVTASAITWSGGRVPHETFEHFGFEVEAPSQPGTLSFSVAVTAGVGGETASVPVTVVTAGGGEGAGSSGTTVAPAPPSTGAPTTSLDPGGSGRDSEVASRAAADDAKDKASTATTFAIVAVVISILALAAALSVGRRRGRPARPAAPQDF